jgi:hypothetical protein
MPPPAPGAPATELLPAAGVDDVAPVAPPELDSNPPRSDVVPQAAAIAAASHVHANRPAPQRNVDIRPRKAPWTALGKWFGVSGAAAAQLFAAKPASKAGAGEGRA